MTERRSPRYKRCLDLLRVIASEKGVNRTFLANYFHCSVRTIADDIALLKKSGFDISYSNDGYELHGEVPFFAFEQPQLLALFIGTQLLTATPLEEDAHDAFHRLFALLPDEKRQFARELTNRIYLADGGKTGSFETLFTVYQAVSECRTLQIAYQHFSTGETKTYCIEPYGIHLKDQFRSYVVGKRLDDNDSGYRRFKLCRILKAKLLGNFMYPAGFSIEEEVRSGFWSGGHTQEIVLRFTPAVAQLVREREPEANIKTLPDRSLRVRKRVRHVKEVLWDVLSYEANVEVIAPEELRQLVQATIDEMKQVYERGLDITRQW